MIAKTAKMSQAWHFECHEPIHFAHLTFMHRNDGPRKIILGTGTTLCTEALGASLKTNDSLHKLFLQANTIGDSGAQALRMWLLCQGAELDLCRYGTKGGLHVFKVK